MDNTDFNKFQEDGQYSYLLQESPNVIFSLSKKYFLEQEFQQSYTILHLLVYKGVNIPNLHYNLAKLAMHLDNDDLVKMHLRQELNHYDNLAALNLLEKLEVGDSFPSLTLFLCIMISIIYFFFFDNISQMEIFLYALHIDNITIFSLFTSFFMHSSYLHLFSNLIVLLILGSFLEKFLSKIQYISIFLISGIISNLIQVLISSQNTLVVGISGSIFAFLAVLLFRAPMLSFKIKNLNISILILVFLIYIISVLTYNQSFVAHYSHLFGFLIGAGLCSISNSFMRSRFYPLLIYIFGCMLFTSILLPDSAPIFLLPIVDAIVGLFCVFLAYAFLSKREEYLLHVN